MAPCCQPDWLSLRGVEPAVNVGEQRERVVEVGDVLGGTQPRGVGSRVAVVAVDAEQQVLEALVLAFLRRGRQRIDP
jgi:hypothetical protein